MGTTYRCLIVDDETPAHKAIASHIGKFEELEYSGSAFSGVEAIKMLKENVYDILFLDINMPVLSGVEFMELQFNRPATIVTTAYSDYALSAYQNDAIDYLLKPISLEKFAKAIEKATTHLLGRSLKISNNTKGKFLSYRVNGEMMQLRLAEIIYIESLGNYLKIFCVKMNLPIIVYGSLSSIFSELDSLDFIQVHRSFIINRFQIIAINNKTITMGNQDILPVGRKYKIMLDSL